MSTRLAAAAFALHQPLDSEAQPVAAGIPGEIEPRLPPTSKRGVVHDRNHFCGALHVPSFGRARPELKTCGARWGRWMSSAPGSTGSHPSRASGTGLAQCPRTPAVIARHLV